ncbi:methionine/alanine import family NSS transporter small subunit [Dietzia sp.]
MTTTAIIMMVLFLLIVWGGLVLSIANFVRHPDLTEDEVDPAST